MLDGQKDSEPCARMEEGVSHGGKERAPGEDEAIPEGDSPVHERLADGASPGQVGEGNVREDRIAHRTDRLCLRRVLPGVVPVVEIRRSVDTPVRKAFPAKASGRTARTRPVPRDTDATKRLARKRTSDTAAAYVSQEEERLGFQRRGLR